MTRSRGGHTATLQDRMAIRFPDGPTGALLRHVLGEKDEGSSSDRSSCMPEWLDRELRGGDGGHLEVVRLNGSDLIATFRGPDDRLLLRLSLDNRGRITDRRFLRWEECDTVSPEEQRAAEGELPWLDTALVHAHRDLGLMGAAVLVVQADTIVHQSAVGWSDWSTREAADGSTRFGWASVSKVVTALGVLALVDSSGVELDQPVNGYLRRLRVRSPRGSRPVTPRDLLTHRSGGLVVPGTFARASEATATSSTDRAMELIADGPPGVSFDYANSNTEVLGQLIADVTGSEFDSWTAASILHAIGCVDVGYVPKATSPSQYAVIDGLGWKLERSHLPSAAGGLLGSTTAFAPLLSELAKGARSLLAPATSEQMFSTQPPTGSPPRYGLGLPLSNVGGNTVAYHSGRGPGITSLIAVVPRLELGIAIVTNTDDIASARPIHRRFQRLVSEVLLRLSKGR